MVMGVVCSWVAVSHSPREPRTRGDPWGAWWVGLCAPFSRCRHLVFGETEPHEQTPVCVMLESFLYAGRVRTN